MNDIEIICDLKQNDMQKLEQRLIELAQIGSENENNERSSKKKIEELKTKLSGLLEETNQQDETVKKMDRIINVMKMEMEEKENMALQLQDEVYNNFTQNRLIQSFISYDSLIGT